MQWRSILLLPLRCIPLRCLLIVPNHDFFQVRMLVRILYRLRYAVRAIRVLGLDAGVLTLILLHSLAPLGHRVTRVNAFDDLGCQL